MHKLLGLRGATTVCQQTSDNLKTVSRHLSNFHRLNKLELRPCVFSLEQRSQFLQNKEYPCRIQIRGNTQHRIVLIPEVPADTAKTNVLLQDSPLPDLVSVSEENCYNALGKVLLEYESAVVSLEENLSCGEEDWHKLLADIETTRVNLENVWNTVNLISISTDKLDMDRFTVLNKRAERAFLTRYDSKAIHEFIHSDKVDGVQGEDKTLLERYRYEYKNQGFDLPGKKYLELNANWIKRLTEAQRDYKFKVSTATQRFRHVIRDPTVVREFPVDLLRAMSADSDQPSRGPWSVTLHPYIYRKFLEYCPDRKIRWNAYVAYISRGSKEVDIYLNAAGQVKDIRQHRLDQAVTIGYDCYADMSLSSKMAGSIENVNSFIASMHGTAKTAQEIELASLQEYAESRGFEDSIREFDVEFFKRKQIKTLFGIDEETTRDFFPLPHILKTLFALLADHYDLVFELVNKSNKENLWREEVSLYKVSNKSGGHIGYCYLDPYIRDDKGYNGGDRGWFIPVRSHSAIGGSTTPVGCVVMALSNPGYGKPSLLSLNEVEELFRLFGKAIMHMTVRNQWIETSGRTGIEWDALDLIPNLMTQWLMVPSMLQSLTCHWSTGEKLSLDVIENQIDAKKHMSGYALSHELFKAAYDISFYSSEYESEQYQNLAERLTPQYLVLAREVEDCFPIHFEEMMHGNWCAGYYSHLWSKMLAADAFSAYWEAGWDNAGAVSKISKKLSSTLLATGSSRPTAEVFREFRGRDPNPEALMISLGLRGSRAPKKRVTSS